jgi:hypothetical protein
LDRRKRRGIVEKDLKRIGNKIGNRDWIEGRA